MIVYRQGLVLSASLAHPLKNPRIGYENHARSRADADVTVSDTAVGAAKDAPLRPDTFEFWEPLTLPATWTVDLGAARDIDYVGIAGHTFGSAAVGVKVEAGSDSTFPAPYLSLPGASGNYASTPDSAANSITGDIDLRVKVALNDYTPAGDQVVASKWVVTGNQRAALLRVTSGGLLRLLTSPNGTIDDASQASSVAIGAADGSTIWLRATRASATGLINYYTSTDYNPATGTGTWTPLGAANRTSTLGAIFNSTAGLAVGSINAGTAELAAGRVYYAEWRNGIGGPVVARFNPADGHDGAASFTSATGEVWTVNTSGGSIARLTNQTLSTEIAPADDAPLLFLDELRSARYVRITLTGTLGAVKPRLAVVYAGKALAMPYSIYGGHTPLNLSRSTDLTNTLSEGGEFIGQDYVSHGVKGSVGFKWLEAAWYRANFDPFVKEARRFPYFWAWRPSDFPREVGYVWTGDDIAPSNMGRRTFMQVSVGMVGVGHE